MKGKPWRLRWGAWLSARFPSWPGAGKQGGRPGARSTCPLRPAGCSGGISLGFPLTQKAVPDGGFPETSCLGCICPIDAASAFPSKSYFPAQCPRQAARYLDDVLHFLLLRSANRAPASCIPDSVSSPQGPSGVWLLPDGRAPSPALTQTLLARGPGLCPSLCLRGQVASLALIAARTDVCKPLPCRSTRPRFPCRNYNSS